LTEARQAFGLAVLIDCHSMPSNPIAEQGGARPDFVLGDRYGTSCCAELTRAAAQALKVQGYVVALNKPYAGGYITEHYGRPHTGLHALQVEINRALYMNETTFDKASGFDRIRQDLEGMARAVMAAIPEIAIPRAAAE
jgi:N-formylglutamate amidohydrolase